MKKTVISASILLLAITTVFAQAKDKAAASAGSTLEPKIRKAWEDFVKKDKDAVGKIMTADAVEIWADGKGPRDKQSTLSGMQDVNITKYTLSDFKFKPIGNQAQLATYNAYVEFTSGSTSMKGNLAVSEVWEKQGKDWKLVHYQETEVK